MNGAYIRQMQVQNPYSVVISSCGKVYVSSHGDQNIHVFDAEGTPIQTLNIQTTVHGLAVDQDGNILAVDYSHSLASVFRPDGTLLKSFGEGHMTNPMGVALDSEGRAIFGDNSNNRLYVCVYR
jgi:DNA-binding beta-propeller fold protein YncE